MIPRSWRTGILTAMVLLPLLGAAAQSDPGVAAPRRFLVGTEPGLEVEVLDWAGSGPPLVLLAGLGASADSFDASFVADLRHHFHVYGVTRRGYGRSSAPRPDDYNYRTDRLADDVLAVLDSLHLQKPLLVGHSFAGAELSSIGSRYPGRVAGLVYLDAGYRYALSGPGLGDFQIDTITMRRYLADALDGLDPAQTKISVEAFLKELPAFVAELQAYSSALGKAAPVKPDDLANERKERSTPEGQAERAILDGEQRYSLLHCPALVVFAYPHALPTHTGEDARKQLEASDTAFVDQRLNLFRAQTDVTVLLLPHATHDVQTSRRVEVVAAIDKFAARVEPR